MVFLNCVRVQIYTMRIHIRKIIVWNPSLGDSIITLMKILFSASIRTDGSSRFQKDNRWGTFGLSVPTGEFHKKSLCRI